MILFLFLVALYIMALIIVVILAVVSLVLLGSGATALAAGGIASTTLIKNKPTKNLTVLVCSAVFLFAVCCFALLGVILWGDARIPLLVLGFVSGLATLVLAIIGIANVRKLDKMPVKVLFIILFSLVIGLSIVALAVFVLAACYIAYTTAYY